MHFIATLVLFVGPLLFGAAANRLVHRAGGTPRGGIGQMLHEAAEALGLGGHDSGRGKTAPKTLDPFVVLHADATWTDALTVLLDAQPEPGPAGSVWLYGDMPRWNSEHVNHLWSFACGRTAGRWPMCGVEGLGPDPFDPASIQRHKLQLKELHGYDREKRHRHRRVPPSKRSVRPRAVGFALDLNLLLGDKPRVCPALVDAGAKVIVLLPKSLTRNTLRDAEHGALSPLTAAVPGREAGVARAQYSYEGEGQKDVALLARERHMRLLCDDPDPTNLIKALRRQESERDALRAAAKELADDGLSVLTIDLDAVLAAPVEALRSLYAFLLADQGDAQAVVEAVSVPATLRELLGSLDAGPDVLEDCADAMETARVRLAVQDQQDSADLIADMDSVLAQVERTRTKRPTPARRPKKKKTKIATAPDEKKKKKTSKREKDAPMPTARSHRAQTLAEYRRKRRHAD